MLNFRDKIQSVSREQGMIKDRTGFGLSIFDFRRKKRNQRAFTLIEMMIATTIFVVGVVALFPLISNGLSMIADTRKQMVVISLAQERLAMVEALSFDNTFVDVDIKTPFPGNTDFLFTEDWEPVVSDVVSGSDVLYKYTLSVFWKSRHGEKSEVFVVFITRMKPF